MPPSIWDSQTSVSGLEDDLFERTDFRDLLQDLAEATTRGWDSVSVPVLPKTTVSIEETSSRARPSLIRMPFSTLASRRRGKRMSGCPVLGSE